MPEIDSQGMARYLMCDVGVDSKYGPEVPYVLGTMEIWSMLFDNT